MRILMLAAAVAALSTGPAFAAPSAASSKAEASSAVRHGAPIAARSCAICHAVGPTGASLNGGAPPFRTLRIRYNSLTLERALQRISKQGHFEMRPLAIAPADMADVAAYIESLDPDAR